MSNGDNEEEFYEIGGTELLTSPDEIVDACKNIISLRNRIVREPTQGLGKFAYTSEERFMLRQGRNNLLDSFILFLTARAATSGGDVDGLAESGALTISLLPVRGRSIVYRHIVPFRYSYLLSQIEEKVKTLGDDESIRPKLEQFLKYTRKRRSRQSDPKKTTIPDEATSTENAESGPDQAVSLDWKKAEMLLEIAERDDPDKIGVEIGRLLDDPEVVTALKELWGGSLQIPDYKPEWVRPDKGFDLTRAVECGEAMWVPDWILPTKFTHAYTTGFMAPSKEWLNKYINDYFENHPQSKYLKFLMRATRKGIACPLGKGRMRHYSYEELCIFPGDSVEEQRKKRQNQKWWARHWELFWHIDQARKKAFTDWCENLRNSVEGYRAFEATGSTNNASFLVQMPPSFQYSWWQDNETRIETTSQSGRQSLADRSNAMEKVAQTMRWAERLPRVWKDGSIHFRWWSNPEHEKAMGGHCNGCWHADEWFPAERYGKQIKPELVSEEYPHTEHWYQADLKELFPKTNGRLANRTADPSDPVQWTRKWVYEEAQSWYPTRQEVQLVRKILYTHNAGSGFYDIFRYDLVSEGDAKTLRNNYFFSGNEAAPGIDFWWPGAVDSNIVDSKISGPEPGKITAAQYLATYPGVVARDWWLGPFANLWQTGERNPFNSYGLDSWDVSLPVQDSWKKFKDLLAANWSRAGIKGDDLRKMLPDLNDSTDGLVFPNNFHEEDTTVEATGNFAGTNKKGEAVEWKRVEIVFEPMRYFGLERYSNMAFHLDPTWFERRNLYDPTLLRRHVRAYEDAFSSWIDPKSLEKKFTGTHEFVMTWPNGKTSTVTSFQDESFKMYLVANWLHHHTLADDLFENQDLYKVKETILRKVKFEESHGQAELRDLITKETSGLPSGMVTWTGQLLEKADLRLIKFAAFLAEGRGGNRGLQFGTATGWFTKGFGQGYTTEEQGFKMSENLFLIALYCKYWDNIKGLVEAKQMDPEAWDINKIRENLTKLVGSRGVNWAASEEAADLLPWGPLGVVPAEIPQFPKMSDEVEARWKAKLAKLFYPWDETASAEKLLSAMADGKLFSFPETPAGIRRHV